MIFDEGNLEYLFVRHAVEVMGNPPNTSGQDMHAGGEWIAGNIRLTWGQRTVTEPPTLHHSALGTTYLPRELEERIQVWKSLIANIDGLNFRDRIILTAILAWTPPASTS